MPSEEELRHPEAGGFVNAGYLQLSRPNFFLVPQRLFLPASPFAYIVLTVVFGQSVLLSS